MFKWVNKQENYAQIVIPMQDESHAGMFAYNDWVYCLDGKKHGRMPAIILPELVDIFGGEVAIRKAGYRKCWDVFENLATGECTFGNKPSLSTGDAYEQEMARNMPTTDIELLKTL